MNKHTVNYQLPHAGLLRRLAALFYDTLVMAAVLLAASALTLPLTHGRDPSVTGPFLTLYLLCVSFGFSAWFWTHGGQTLGMRAWRVKLTRHDGSPVDWPAAAKRFLLGLPAWIVLLAGLFYGTYAAHIKLPNWLRDIETIPSWWVIALGAAWIVLDHSPWSWRDRWSHTAVLHIPRGAGAVKSSDAAE